MQIIKVLSFGIDNCVCLCTKQYDKIWPISTAVLYRIKEFHSFCLFGKHFDRKLCSYSFHQQHSLACATDENFVETIGYTIKQERNVHWLINRATILPFKLVFIIGVYLIDLTPYSILYLDPLSCSLFSFFVQQVQMIATNNRQPKSINWQRTCLMSLLLPLLGLYRKRYNLFLIKSKT